MGLKPTAQNKRSWDSAAPAGEQTPNKAQESITIK
jgi:hypothetical protein